jgi:hypothetical protein
MLAVGWISEILIIVPKILGSFFLILFENPGLVFG